MGNAMGEWTIDARNPGEVLACAGLAHLAWRADRDAQTGFVADIADRVRFVAAQAPPLLAALRSATVEATAHGLRLGPITLDWWRPWGLNHALRNWAGQQSAWMVHRSLRRGAGDASPAEWLTFAAPADGRLYLDPAGSWSAIGLGWSVNAHPTIRMQCRPWLELLASIALQAFPVPGHRARGGFRYNLWRPAPMTAAVAAFGGPFSRAYALGCYCTQTAKCGENTVLRRATPITSAERRSRHGDVA